MGVYDRWHKALGPDGVPCREHSRGTTRLYPSAAHGKGVRWQVRWYDPDTGKQEKRSFRLKEGRNPSLHADAFAAQVERDIDTGNYTDPDSAEITFREFAEDVRKARSHDDVTAVQLERFLRLHAYPHFGDRTLREMSRRPSLTQAWVKGLEASMAPYSARQVVSAVSGIYAAAQADGLISANPVRSTAVTRPRAVRRKARAWTREMVAAMGAALAGPPPSGATPGTPSPRGRYQVIPELGAGTGMRQGEIFGLAVDDVAFLSRDPRVQVLRQVKHVRGVMCFAPPKRRKTRETPLAPEVAALLAAHLAEFPAADVTLPWHDPRDRARHGKPATFRLVVTDAKGRAVDRDVFNRLVWHPAQLAAGIPRERENGMHALRHTYASVQLGAGIDVLSVAAWIGDTPQVVWDTYAHFMPGREEGGRAAVSQFLGPQGAPEVPRGASGSTL